MPDGDDLEKAWRWWRRRAVLDGVAYRAWEEGGLARALHDLLFARLPVHDWVAEVPAGPLRKYGLLHTTLRAPTDSRTGQPMALELAGHVVSVGGRSAEEGDWMGDFRQGIGMADWLVTPVTGHIEIRIDVANYSNVASPGVGVPVYM